MRIIESNTVKHSGISPGECLRYRITRSVLDGETALYSPLSGIGKSRNIPTIVSGSGIPTSVFTNLRENYNQYEDWAGKEDIRCEKQPTSDNCPTLSGKYPNDQAAQKARELASDGWSIGLIHREVNGLPCQQNGKCPYEQQKQKMGGRGIEVGHYTQAYNPNYTEGRVVVLDESAFEAYTEKIRNPVEKANTFLEMVDSIPLDKIPYNPDEDEVEEAIAIIKKMGIDPYDHRKSAGDFHAKGPAVALEILSAERLENGLNYAELPRNRRVAFENPHEGVIRMFNPPDFSEAEAVIALDATPCVSDWELLLGDDLEHYRLFDKDDRNHYLREQGYRFRQLNNHVWPVSGGDISIDKCEAYLREVYREHDKRPDLITSKRVKRNLKDEDLDHLWGDDLHYGDLRGKNDLRKTELLVVLGSPSRSDIEIQYQAVIHGESAQPTTDEDGNRLTGYDLDYQSDVANDILDSIRRGGVFQAMMRAGRDDDAEATVYIATGMIPEWLEVEKLGRGGPNGRFDACLNLRSEGQKQVIDVLRDAEGISASELAAQVDISKDQAKKHRQNLQRSGVVEKKGERRWARYHDSGLDSINTAGSVDLNLSGYIPYKDPIRGSTPIESSADAPVDPREQYPDWMLEVLHETRQRWGKEQMKQRAES